VIFGFFKNQFWLKFFGKLDFLEALFLGFWKCLIFGYFGFPNKGL
jgi:hypothetical protein